MRDATCRYCGIAGFWDWSFQDKKPILMTKDPRYKCNILHQCHSGDIFPGWCKVCNRTDLHLVRGEYFFTLVEEYGLPHTCTENGETDIVDVSTGRCKYCNTEDLLWIFENSRFQLVAKNGTPHKCQQYDTLSKAWAEAKRMDYAFEKKWVNSKADDHVCAKCDGKTYTLRMSKNKRVLRKFNSSEPIAICKPCRHCKSIGIFSVGKKKKYLKALRQKYWPYRAGVHKWEPKVKEYDD